MKHLFFVECNAEVLKHLYIIQTKRNQWGKSPKQGNKDVCWIHHLINEQKVENDLINDWIVCHTSFRFTTTRRKNKKGGNISWMLAFVSIHMACEYKD